jgi:hypothetical protein
VYKCGVGIEKTKQMLSDLGMSKINVVEENIVALKD